ncbi:MAG: hypothetical protein IPM97_05020 [Bdellovibrionaceae bacterium]|nr:hypothetical protein [Pseudobdellovibrionaceae bacterium]
MSRILLFCFVLVLTAGLRAHGSSTESVFTGVTAKGERVFGVLYVEGKVWVVDEIVQHADGWQDLLSRRYAQDRKSAQTILDTIQQKFLHLQIVNPTLDLQPNPAVLKGGSLWPTTQAWDWEWEKRYSQWLSENMTSDFYSKYGIATDCADVAYAARWIFARINGLPAANRLSGSGVLLTNQSLRTEWAQLPTAKNWFEDKRFRAALNYLLNQTYTHTLMRDSYPVAITTENFLPGVHYLDLRELSGHTQLVHRREDDQGILPYMIIESTIPRKVRVLNKSLFWGTEQAKKNQSGFLRIRWPLVKNNAYSLANSEKMPGYSLEQYSPDFIREKDRPYSVEILLRLNPNLNFAKLAESGYQNLIHMFQARVDVVEEGFRQCSKPSCPGDSQLYEDWSTPSRDKRLLEMTNQLELLSNLPFPDQIRDDIQKIKNQALSSVAISLANETFTLKALIFAWKNKLFSSDPNDEPGIRWGLAPEFFANKLQRDLNKVLSQRKLKISREGDNLLKRDLIVSGKYCEHFSQEHCLRFTQNELPKPFQLLGKTKSLQQWLEFSLWLNSDPLQTPANQWGALQEGAKFQRLTDDVKLFKVSKDGIGYLEMKSGERQMGTIGSHGIENEPLPSSFHWINLDEDTSTAWAISDQQLLHYDFKTRIQNIFALPATGEATVLSADSSQILLRIQDSIWNLKLENGDLKTLWNAAVSSSRFFESQVLLGKIGDQWTLFDFSTSVPRVIPTNEDLSSAFVFKNTNLHIGLLVNNKSIFINKENGVLTDVSSLGLVAKWSDGLSRALVYNPSPKLWSLLSLDSNFNIVSSEKLSKWVITHGNFFVAFNTEFVPSIYHLKGEDFAQILPLADEAGPAFTPWESLPWTLMKLKTADDTYRLRNLENSQILYEGKPIYVITEQSTQTYAFSLVEGQRETPLISLKNPKKPALMTGEFFSGGRITSFLDAAQQKISINRGLILSYQGFKFWVEFQQ